MPPGAPSDNQAPTAVPEPTHLYRNAGTYTVSLGVSDGTATTELEVVVGGEEEPSPPDDALAVTASATPAGGTSRDVALAAD